MHSVCVSLFLVFNLSWFCNYNVLCIAHHIFYKHHITSGRFTGFCMAELYSSCHGFPYNMYVLKPLNFTKHHINKPGRVTGFCKPHFNKQHAYILDALHVYEHPQCNMHRTYCRAVLLVQANPQFNKHHTYSLDVLLVYVRRSC